MLASCINVDFHIHSVASAYKDHRIVAESTVENLDVLFKQLDEHDINLIAFTDHNRFDPQLYRAVRDAVGTGRCPSLQGVLAGVEFDVRFDTDKRPCHVIALFDICDPDSDPDKINAVVEANQLNSPDKYYEASKLERILWDIGLRVMLIAHQHEGLDAKQRGSRSLAGSTDHAQEMLRFGYLNAVEYSSSRVQGILKSELHELNVSVPVVTGSDCHEWSAYPAHDSSQPSREQYCTRMKCLPTFQGLLMAFTSPETRLQVSAPRSNAHSIKSFSIGGQTVELSPGLNAIIGENGSGKSSLLELLISSNPNQAWVKKFKQRAEVETSSELDVGSAVIVRQGDLRNRFDNGAARLFGEDSFDSVSHATFEHDVRTYSDALKACIQVNIRAEANRRVLGEADLSLRPDLEAQTHNIIVNIPDGFTQVDNPHKARAQKLSEIAKELEAEAEHTYFAVHPEEREALIEARRLIETVRAKVEARGRAVECERAARTAIFEAVDAYNASVTAHQTERDAEIREYRNEKAAFIDAMLAVAEDIIYVPEPLPTLVVSTDVGVSRRIDRGFTFMRVARYLKSVDIQADLLKALFNSRYRTVDQLLAIKKVDELGDAVRGANAENWSMKWDSNLSKFLSEFEETEYSIMDTTDGRGIGNTFGEQSLAYFKYYSSDLSGWNVMILDQPEDDISNSAINGQLIGHFNRIRYGHQVIFATHNPLLVVNQDVDNVIVLNQEQGKISVVAGCLDEPEVLREVADHMDGGRAAIEKRLKAYGACAEG